WSLHHEGQLESGNSAVGVRQQAGCAPEIELTCRYRGRAGQRQPDRRAFHAHLVHVRHALGDFQVDGERLVGRFPGAELAAARHRPPLDAPQQLLHVEAGDGAFAAGQTGRAIQRLGEVEDAAARALDGEAEIALALELADAEQLAETLLEIDVAELQLRL